MSKQGFRGGQDSLLREITSKSFTNALTSWVSLMRNYLLLEIENEVFET